MPKILLLPKATPRRVYSKSYILIVIIIIAAFLRLYNITELPAGLYPDEAIYANNGVEAWENTDFSAEGGPAIGWKVFYPENYGREGLWPNIIGFFVIKFGHEPWVPRSVAAVFGILTVLGLYFLTKELLANRLSRKIALLSAFLMATSFWHINFSRIGFRAIMAPMFLVWGIYFLLAALNRISNRNNGQIDKFKIRKSKFIIPAILGGILYGLGFYSYIAYRATPLLIFIILLLYWLKVGREAPKDSDVTSEPTGQADAKPNAKPARKKILLVAFLFSLIALIVFAPLGLYFLQNPQDFFGRTTQISIFSAEGGAASGGNSLSILKNLSINILKTAGMFNFIGDWNWRHNVAGAPLLFWPVGILFLIGIFLGLRMFFAGARNRIFREEYLQAYIVLFSWIVIAALPVVVSNEGIPHALRAILMAPAVFILAGIGGIWLYQWATKYEFFTNIRIKTITKIFIAVFLSLLILESYNTYFVLWGQNPNVYGAFNADYVQIGRDLNNLPKELPKYVVVEATGVDVRGIPMPAQTVMFITDTFAPEKQKEKNIYYVLPNQKDKIPEGSYVTILR